MERASPACWAPASSGWSTFATRPRRTGRWASSAACACRTYPTAPSMGLVRSQQLSAARGSLADALGSTALALQGRKVTPTADRRS
eukprot:scaffold1311_cov323-Prasinococcus_capsulatus_cf.AAC.3